MPSDLSRDAQLRTMLADVSSPGHVDLDAVIRRSRRRRRARGVVVASVTGLAVVGIAFAAVEGVRLPQAAMQASEESAGSSADESMLFGARDELAGAGACQAQPVEHVPAGHGIVAAADFAREIAAASAQLEGAVVLTNTTLEEMIAVETVSTVSLSRAGSVVASDTSTVQAMESVLAPGESLTVPVAIVLTDCGSGAPLAPGAYELHAQVALRLDDGSLLELAATPSQVSLLG